MRTTPFRPSSTARPRCLSLGTGLLPLLLLPWLLAGCARMGTPDGGWYDETPPSVVGASPADKATGVRSQKVRIVFDEFIKVDNPSEKIVVSPPQLEMPEIKATGKRIEVELKDSLKPNTTYTIDFSDAITDNNEGNPLGNYTYSFSTGSEIDTLEVSGYVLQAENLEPVKGILVGLYEAPAPDSLFLTQPLLRVSRTDSRGHFVVKGVRPTAYAAYALQDADGNYFFNQKSETLAFGIDSLWPSCRPDVRQDTVWRDTLHIETIHRIPYTHFLPDDLVLRAFTEEQTDRYLIKAERQEADHFTLYFSHGSTELPLLQGLNYDSADAFVLEVSAASDTLTYWLRDTTLVNQDTLMTALTFLMTDTTGTLVSHTDTLPILAKQPYAKRLKLHEKEREEWFKKQEKLRKRGEAYDSIMPQEPLRLKLNLTAQLDPDRNIGIESPTPFSRIDTTGIHLYTKIDTLWYRARFAIDSLDARHCRLRAEWKPGQEYSLEIDSAAMADIYGHAIVALKQGFGVKSLDAYSTLLVQMPGMAGRPVVAELLSSSDAVMKRTTTDNGNAEFFYVNPGTYYLRIFVDENRNGRWDTGLYSEGRQPEPVFYYHEDIECKAKWDVSRTWNPTERPLYQQKPAKLTKQKADKQKTVRNRNAERAEKLGIKYEK